jgi:hypothetical protein
MTTTVRIPGEVYATYRDDGCIVDLAFFPSGSDAGYFGPAAQVFDGDSDLDVETTDGPFWTAMQSYLADDSTLDWRE